MPTCQPIEIITFAGRFTTLKKNSKRATICNKQNDIWLKKFRVRLAVLQAGRFVAYLYFFMSPSSRINSSSFCCYMTSKEVTAVEIFFVTDPSHVKWPFSFFLFILLLLYCFSYALAWWQEECHIYIPPPQQQQQKQLKLFSEYLYIIHSLKRAKRVIQFGIKAWRHIRLWKYFVCHHHHHYQHQLHNIKRLAMMSLRSRGREWAFTCFVRLPLSDKVARLSIKIYCIPPTPKPQPVN